MSFVWQKPGAPILRWPVRPVRVVVGFDDALSAVVSSIAGRVRPARRLRLVTASPFRIAKPPLEARPVRTVAGEIEGLRAIAFRRSPVPRKRTGKGMGGREEDRNPIPLPKIPLPVLRESVLCLQTRWPMVAQGTAYPGRTVQTNNGMNASGHWLTD